VGHGLTHQLHQVAHRRGGGHGRGYRGAGGGGGGYVAVPSAVVAGSQMGTRVGMRYERKP
jgi:hypothetical protein